jgi:hypothetical protein
MRAIWKVTSGELLIKQAIRKNINYYYYYYYNIQKNTYILKLLLNIVTTGIEAPVILGNKLWYACIKEVCHL